MTTATSKTKTNTDDKKTTAAKTKAKTNAEDKKTTDEEVVHAKEEAKAAHAKEEAKAVHEKAIRDKNNTEMKQAKRHLIKFQETEAYRDLPGDVQAALKRVCGKVRVVCARDTFADTLTTLFSEVDSVSELQIFLKTKMGRGEFRKRIRESLKKAEPAKRMWVEFNESEETWELLATGEALPKGFRGAPIDAKKSTVKERSRN